MSQPARPPFEFRESYDDDGAYMAGEREGQRFVNEGHDLSPWLWPVNHDRFTDFAIGFFDGVAGAELSRRGLPHTFATREALQLEWRRDLDAHRSSRADTFDGHSSVLWSVPNEFDPLDVFAAASPEKKILNLFAGPGGFDEAGSLLGIADQIYGIDVDRDACNTARARGFRRHQGDVTAFDPKDFAGVRGLIVTPPCPSFSVAGKTNPHFGRDLQQVFDAITGLGSDHEYYTTPAELRASVSDQRTALAYEVARWALRAPNVEWVIAENVPAIEGMYEELSAELEGFGWSDFSFVKVKAQHFGAASKRDRSFFIAKSGPGVATIPEHGLGLQGTTMAQALRWPPGERVNTRGNRKTSGGNEFSADQVAWCLTEKARSWQRVSDGRRLTPSEAGVLNGFGPDYPWRGSESKKFHQIADVVNPLVGAAILGAATGLPWQEPVLRRVQELYGVEASQELQATAPTVDIDRPHSPQPAAYEQISF